MPLIILIYTMANNGSPSSAILYQNVDRTVVLLDIPKSISLAQGTLDYACTDKIYSSPPLEAPYPSTEPKSAKAKANIQGTKVPIDSDLEFPTTLLYQALEEIDHHWRGGWCLMRKISPFVTAGRSKKRKLLEAEDLSPSLHVGIAGPDLPKPLPVLSFSGAENPAIPPRNVEPNLRVSEELSSPKKFSDPSTLPVNLTSAIHVCSNIRQFINRLVNNSCVTSVSLVHGGTSFRIPPNASFFMSKVTETTALIFSMGALTMYPSPSATAGPGQFDFILLDPPWRNRSAKRSAKYDTMCDMDPVALLQSLLGQHIAQDGLIACWITNNPRVRAAALEAFAAWEVQLIEEWAWLKTTVLGVPVTHIEGVWRQPFEILLLGKRVNEVGVHRQNPKRRVIVSVPDYHSRKPNLKELIEPILPARYRALEIFGRYVSAGWWVWGDEVLKYNWEGHWSKESEY